MNKLTKSWKEHFKTTQYNKLAFIGGGADRWVEEHNKAIETEIIEKIIDDIPDTYLVNRSDASKILPLDDLRELKQQLKEKWL